MGTAHIATWANIHSTFKQTSISKKLGKARLLQRITFHCYLHYNWCSNLSFIVLRYLSMISHLKATGYRESIQKSSEESPVSGIGHDVNSAQLKGRDELWLQVSKCLIEVAKLLSRHLIYQSAILHHGYMNRILNKELKSSAMVRSVMEIFRIMSSGKELK